jgi:hypothetical protein
MAPPGPRPWSILLAPAAAALAWTIASLIAPDAPAAGAAVVAPALALLPIGFAVALLWARREDRAALRPWIALGPCLLAPLSVIAPWAVLPSRLGPAHAGLRFFLGALARAADAEILVGLVGVVGSAAIPAAFAAHALGAREPSARVLRLLLLAQIAAYLPVLLRLDVVTLWHGAAALGRGQILEGASTASGALLRALASGAMVAWVGRDRAETGGRRRKRRG